MTVLGGGIPRTGLLRIEQSDDPGANRPVVFVAWSFSLLATVQLRNLVGSVREGLFRGAV
jgi:hypothetical protein